ncbi:MAG: formate/nitrite transporter family protein [Planctomycetes bacterium]|nr:formate/nitrite transporter family protein [Planctomycetota bacterium]
MADTNSDAYAPQEIAQRVATVGVAKARRNLLSMLVLAVLAGAFVALGGLFYAVTVTGSELGFGITRLLGGMAFSLGLILVVVAGAELFTGNNLIAMAWASRLITTRELLRGWVIVYAGNAIGAIATAAGIYLAGVHDFGKGAVEETLMAVATHKAGLAPLEMFVLGVMCNALVCLAVWLAMAGHTVTDKILGIVPPITAFVAIGFENSISNLFFLPLALMLRPDTPGLLQGSLLNIALVTAGNIVGGTVLVAGVYWLAYLRDTKK